MADTTAKEASSGDGFYLVEWRARLREEVPREEVPREEMLAEMDASPTGELIIDQVPRPTVRPSTRSDNSLVRRTLDVERQIAALQAERYDLAVEIERRRTDGRRRRIDPDIASNPFRFPTFGTWLAAETHTSERECVRVLTNGTDLLGLSEVRAALADGEIADPHVRQMLRVYRKFPNEAIDAQATMIGWARSMKWPEFLSAIDALIELLDDSDPAEEAAKCQAKTSMRHTSFGGMTHVEIDLPTDEFNQWQGPIERRAKKLFDDDKAAMIAEFGPDAPFDKMPRTRAQRMVNAMTSLLRAGADAVDPGCRANTDITFDHGTFARELQRWTTGSAPELTLDEALDAAAEYRCHSPRGLKLNPAVSFAAALTGHVMRTVIGADNAVQRSVRRRIFDGPEREGIKTRDRFCTTPGCERPAEECEIDHIVPYSRGGLTESTNGQAKCPRCHRWKTLLEALGFP